MEKVRPGTGREAGLSHAGGRATQGAVAENTPGYLKILSWRALRLCLQDVGKGREQERKLCLQDVGKGREQERKLCERNYDIYGRTRDK